MNNSHSTFTRQHFTSWNGIVLLLLSCLLPCCLFAGATQRAEVLLFHNPLPIERSGEVVSLNRTVFKSTTSLSPLFKKGEKTLITQYIDENKDGEWDKVLVEISMAPGATDTVPIEWVAKTALPAFQNLANVRFSLRSTNGKPAPELKTAMRSRGFVQNIAEPFYQMEGPGIENDKVAFRSFFDARNGKDIYGKITKEPVLDGVGVTGGWHQMQDWGMDILKVGSSLGAGALGINEKGRIYRLGDADSSFYEALYEGPLQASFLLKFAGWDVGSQKGNGSERLTISKGEYYYQNKINVPLQSVQQLVCGLANFSGADEKMTKHNALFSSLSTYAPQADGTKTALGLAILFQSHQYESHATTGATDVFGNTSYVALKPLSMERTLYVFACWEKTDERFATEVGFRTYLQQAADKLANPIQITVKKTTD